MVRVRSLLAAEELPPRFERWEVTIPAHGTRPTDPRDWSGAIVLVERGSVEVECTGGCVRRFSRGDLLAPGWLRARELRNRGRSDARLVAVRRRRASGAADVAERGNPVGSRA